VATQESSTPVVDTEGALAIRIPSDLDPMSGGGKVWMSIKPKTDLDRARVMASLQGIIPKLGDNIGYSMAVTDIALQKVEVTNKDTGEVLPAVRSVLFTGDGKSYSAVSDGVRTSIGVLCNMYGYPPWSPPLPLVMRQVNLSSGHRMYILELDYTKFNSEGNRK
jgi:hypothetical protein